MEMMPATLLKQCHAAILTESDMVMFHMVDSKHFPVIMDMLLPRTFHENDIIILPTHKVEQPELEFFILLEGVVEVLSFGVDEAHDPKTHAMRVAEHQQTKSSRSSINFIIIIMVIIIIIKINYTII